MKKNPFEAFLASVGFVLLDIGFNRVTSVNKRKKLIYGECGLSLAIVLSEFLLFL